MNVPIVGRFFCELLYFVKFCMDYGCDILKFIICLQGDN